MRTLYGVFALVLGLFSLLEFMVRLSIGLAAVLRRFRRLVVDAFSRPPAASDPVVPPPVESDSGSLERGGYWADRDRS